MFPAEASLRSEPARYLGVVGSVLTRPEWEGFTVIRMRCGAAEVSLVDRLVGIDLTQVQHGGLWFCFEGVEEEHPRFGRQVRVTRGPILLEDPRVVSAGLLSEEVPNTLVARARLHLGQDVVTREVLAGRTEELARAVGDEAAARIVRAWESFAARCRLADAARSAGVASLVSAVLQRFLVSEVLEDPWVLLEVEGADPPKVEKFAAHLGVAGDESGRLRATLLFTLRRAAALGHSHLPVRDLCGMLMDLVDGAEIPQVMAAVASLQQAEVVVLDRDVVPGDIMVYDSRIYRVEQGAAELLAQRCRREPPAPGRGGPEQEERGAKLSESQRAAVELAAASPVCAITGLPGTGKTTSLRALVDLLERGGSQVLLVAPTGVAARRLQEATDREASTIHRALAGRVDAEQRESSYVGVLGSAGRQPGIPDPDGVWGCCAATPHHADAVVVDEASMLDEHLFYRILDGTRPSCRLVLVGDPAQLPPVGPGSVLEDLVGSSLVPAAHLVEIFRQAAQSPVIRAAHAVHRGEAPACEVVSAREAVACRQDAFLLVPASTEEEAFARVMEIAPEIYQAGGTAQVLSPRHGGAAGVTALNVGLRARLNPGRPGHQEVQVGAHTIREGDRIMVIQNNYKFGVYNGEIGEVTGVAGGRVRALIHGSPSVPMDMEPREMSRLIRLAYAVTVHKSQGLEYDVVVLPVLPSFGLQMTRRLFYTAITRARRVILVGMVHAVENAVRNEGKEFRLGHLGTRIRRCLEARRRA